MAVLRSKMHPLAGLLGTGLLLVAFGTAGAGGCAQGQVITETDDGGPSSSANSSAAAGGSGGDIGSGGQGGDALPCGIDCGTITTPQCTEAVCDAALGMCVVRSVQNGASCDDGLFCSINDTCIDGECIAGPPNDCGQTAAACNEISCNESTKQCANAPAMNGSSCQDPNNLCQVNTTCNNGVCGGGVPMDCFFAPVPNDCHISQCNPANGMCTPIPGNDGGSCVDAADLCTVSKTCSAGVCQGGAPKDCSQLTQGCNLGVCDTTSGQCTAMSVNNGDPCNDLNSCTQGETCAMGQCAGGTPITQCANADGCCPMGCTEAVDDDCSCNVNLATSATPTSNGGGSGGYGPTAWNNGINQAGCESSGCSGCFGWISNNTMPNGAFMRYEWPAPVQIGSMFVDANQCNVNGCSAMGRGLASGDIQYWDGVQWVTAQSFSGNTGDLTVTFSPKITTTSLRIFNATAPTGCGNQADNTLVYEWYVWPGSNCQP